MFLKVQTKTKQKGAREREKSRLMRCVYDTRAAERNIIKLKKKNKSKKIIKTII